MRIAVLVAALTATPAARAHFLFLVPPAAAGQPFTVAFSDTPAVDAKAGTGMLANGASKAFDGKWADQPLQAGAADGVWRTLEPAAAAKVVTAVADYGLVNRGEGNVFYVRHLAKWSKGVEGVPPESTLPVELTAVRAAAGFCFAATRGGKPMATADVTVYEPGTTRTRTVKTDAQGRTPAFDAAGRYAARVMAFDAVEGEWEGRKYRGTYYYSTLVAEYRP